MYLHAQDGGLAETSFIRQPPKQSVTPQPRSEANVTVGKEKQKASGLMGYFFYFAHSGRYFKIYGES